MPTLFKSMGFPGSISGAFVNPLAAALRSIPSGQDDKDWLADRFAHGGRYNAELIGPFRLFRASSLRLVSTRSMARSCRPIGWRSIFVHDKRGLAVVDVGLQTKRDNVHHHVHGDSIAQRHLDSLSMLAELARANHWKPGVHEMRIVEMPSIFTTALWVPGRVVLPVRLSANDPSRLSSLRPEGFIRTVAALRRMHHRRPVSLGAVSIKEKGLNDGTA